MAGHLSGIMREYDNQYGEITVIEFSDMTIASTDRIASKYIDESNNIIWLEQELGKNAGGDVIYIKVLSRSSDKPSWIADGIIAE